METEFTLREIAEKAKIGEIRTARYYLNQYLPEHHRRGRGKYVKYSRDTLNCFLFLMKLKDETPLELQQISGVMRALSQTQIDRVVSGEEPLEISLAVRDAQGRTQIPEKYLSQGVSSALLVHGNEVEIVKAKPSAVPLYSLRPEPKQLEEDWNVFPISQQAEVRYKGQLTKKQKEELTIASRILKSIFLEKE